MTDGPAATPIYDGPPGTEEDQNDDPAEGLASRWSFPGRSPPSVYPDSARMRALKPEQEPAVPENAGPDGGGSRLPSIFPVSESFPSRYTPGYSWYEDSDLYS